MAHQPGIKGFHTSQATGIRGLSDLQNPSQLHKGFRLLEPTGIKEEDEGEETNEHLDVSDSIFLFKKFPGIKLKVKLITLDMAAAGHNFTLMHSVCVCCLCFAVLERSKPTWGLKEEDIFWAGALRVIGLGSSRSVL